jgi:DNA-binding XRE family transcriptional regulator
MAIGDKIKALRDNKGISQQDLAKAIGVSDQAISAWENNKKVPRMGSVERLASFFDVPKTYLIEDSIGVDKLFAPAAVAAAGFVAGGPVGAAVMGLLTAAGVLANTMDAHGSSEDSSQEALPFLMTKNNDEKELLQLFRALPPEGQKAVITMAKTISNL